MILASHSSQWNSLMQECKKTCRLLMVVCIKEDSQGSHCSLEELLAIDSVLVRSITFCLTSLAGVTAIIAG